MQARVSKKIRAQEKLNLILSRPRVVSEHAKSRKVKYIFTYL